MGRKLGQTQSDSSENVSQGYKINSEWSDLSADATTDVQISSASPKLLSLAGCQRNSSCHPTGTSPPAPISPSFVRIPKPASERWFAEPESFKIFTTTNARAESILDKPIWKDPFTHSRCLVPIDGFYEWLQRLSLPQPQPIEPGEHGLFGDISAPAKPPPKPKAGSRPVYKFEMPDGAPYALAGLFSEWRPRKGSPHPPLDTFSIVTTEANELMEPIHNRMPVILHPRDYDRWLTDYDESRLPIDLLRPFEADSMRMTPANRLVGNVHNNGPEMLNSA